MNETILRWIVTQPWNENYVYAWNFSSLPLVKNVVLSKTCQVVAVPTTVTTLAPTFPSTALEPTVRPSYNGDRFYDASTI